MLVSQSKSSSGKIVKVAATVVAMTALAGCAVNVPLPSFVASSQDSHHRGLGCGSESKCRISIHQVAYHRSELRGGAKTDEDPPDFIVKGGGDRNGALLSGGQ